MWPQVNKQLYFGLGQWENEKENSALPLYIFEEWLLDI
jgi:hypothetical protein